MAFRRLASSVHSAAFSVLLALALFAVARGLGAAPGLVPASSASAPASSASAAPVASAGPVSARPAANEPSRVVYLGVYLHDITKVSLQDGTVDVDAEVWVKWRGEFDAERVVLANGGRVNRTKVREEADGDWHAVTWRIRGPLRGEFPLGEFPFDRQKIALEFSLPTGDGILEPDFAASTVEEHFSITGWMYDAHFVPRVESRQFASDLGRVRDEGRATDVRLVAFDVPLTRPAAPAAARLLAPFLLLVLLVLGGFWLGEEHLTARVLLLGFASLLSIGYASQAASSLPAIHEVTVLDRLGWVAYALVAVAAALTFVIAVLARRDRMHTARDVGRWGRLVLGSAAVLGSLLVLRPVLVRPTLAASAAPAAALSNATPTFPTSRSTLHLGTTLPLAAIPSSLAAQWVFRSLAPVGHSEVEPIYVEEIPSVRSGALRLVPGGGLDVTWRLRADARWSDGEPITTDDVVFRGQLLPTVGARLEVISPREVVIHFSERLAEALEPPEVLPKHTFKRAIDEAGGLEAANASKEGREKLRAAVFAQRAQEPTPGLGPYRIVSFTPRASLVAEANPFWPGKKPAISRIELTRYANSHDLREAFVAGNVDLTTANSIAPDDAEALLQAHPDAVTIRPSARLLELFVDRRATLFATAEGRAAVSAALDRARVVAKIYPRGGAVAGSPIVGLPAKEPVYDASILRSYLASHPPTGAPVPVYCEAASETDCLILAYVVEDLVAAGLPAILKPTAGASDLAKTAHGGIVGLATNAERASVLAHFDVPVVGGLYNADARHDGFDDQTAALWQRYQRALYPERHDQFRERIFERHAALLPTIPLVFPNQRIVAAPALRGWGGPPERFGYLAEDYFFE
jgi:ABC-type transport system substrate-binding protein